MADDRDAFGCRRWVTGGTTVLELRGELDILAATSFSAEFDALAREPELDLVVDLRAVTFADCSGLALLCRIRNRVLAGGGRVRLVVGDPRMLRILRLTRLSEAFEVIDRPLPRPRVPV